MMQAPDPFTSTLALFAFNVFFIIVTTTTWTRFFGQYTFAPPPSSLGHTQDFTIAIIALIVILAFGLWICASVYFGMSIQDHTGTKYTSQNGSSSQYLYTAWVYNDQFSNMSKSYWDLTVFTAAWISIAFYGYWSSKEHKKPTPNQQVENKKKLEESNLRSDNEESKNSIVEIPKRLYGKIIDSFLPILMMLHVLNCVLYESNVYRHDRSLGLIGQPNSTLSEQKYIISVVSDSFLLLLLSGSFVWILNFIRKDKYDLFPTPSLEDTLGHESNGEYFPGFQHMFIFGKIAGSLFNSIHTEYLPLTIVVFDLYHMIVFYLCPTQVFTWVICVPMLSLCFSRMNQHKGSFLHLYVATNAVFYHALWVFKYADFSLPVSKIMFGDYTNGYEHVHYLTNFYDTKMGCRPVLKSQDELMNIETVLLGLASVKLILVCWWAFYACYVFIRSLCNNDIIKTNIDTESKDNV